MEVIMKKTTELIYSGLFVAFGLILPQLFHLFGGTGPIFLPMHIPVLLAGFFLGARSGLLVGLLTPILSSLTTGMPAIPILYFMMFELMTYGFLAGYLYRTRKLNIIVSLLLAMVGGRAVLAVSVFALQALLGLKLSPKGYLTGALTTGVPGMVIQVVLIPVVVRLLDKAGVTFARKHA
jgi:niacin transporter